MVVVTSSPTELVQRAMSAQQSGRLPEAERLYREALLSDPNHFEGLHFLGLLEAQKGNLQEGEGLVRRSLAVNATRAEAYLNHALILRALNRHEEAIATCDKALALNPRFVDALVVRGNALRDLDRPEEALTCIDKGLALQPGHYLALAARADVLAQLGRHEEAIDFCNRALAINPRYMEAIYNRACRFLAKGQFEQGWAGYERRYEVPSLGAQRPVLPGTPWNGEPLEGKSIIVQAEQGLGDNIQFARYVTLLKRNGARVTLLMRPLLWRLLRPLMDGVELLSSVPPSRGFDYQCAMMSLPHRFGTTLATIPADIPYIAAEPALCMRWRERIGDHGFKIGICWHGTPTQKLAESRAIPLEHFVSLARIPGVRLISLQKDHGLDQLNDLPSDVSIETLGDEFDTGSDAFIDTAAVISNLDLVVTADTAVAHVAGALGRTVWVGLRFVPDWRWMLDRTDTPWYPSMRLYRQPARGAWGAVFARMAHDIRELAGATADRR